MGKWTNSILVTPTTDSIPVTLQCRPGPWFNIKVSPCQYRKSHCGDKTIVRSFYLHNGISYTGKMTSLYWFNPLHSDGYVLKQKYRCPLIRNELCSFIHPLPGLILLTEIKWDHWKNWAILLFHWCHTLVTVLLYIQHHGLGHEGSAVFSPGFAINW